MQQQIARTDLLAAAVEGLSEAPVVALLGARQVGKTTLAKQMAGAWQGPFRIFDLEVASVREALSAAPERLLRECEGLVVLDEVQRRAPNHQVHAHRDAGLGAARLWAVYPGDLRYPLAENITALPLKNIHEIGAEGFTASGA